jgi:hypothetical protein
MNIEVLKLALPFITFFLGVAFTPLIESMKERTKRKSLNSNIKKEMQDEIEHLKEAICSMASSASSLEALLKGNQSGVIGPMKFVPRDTKVVFIDEVIKNNYRFLNKQQRRAIKAIPMQIDGIKNTADKISEIEISEENMPKQIQLCKNYIYTACCLRASMLEFIGNGTIDTSDKETINRQLTDIGIKSFSYDTLIKKRSVAVRVNK